MFQFLFPPLPANVNIVTVSPMDHPLRSLVMLIPAVYFAINALALLRKVNTGSTLLIMPSNPLSMRIHSGKVQLTKSQKSAGFIASFNGPLASAFMGLLFFAAAEFLVTTLFMRLDYTF